MKILITGVNGFVGSNLCRYLSSSHKIIGLDQTDSAMNGDHLYHYYNWDEVDSMTNYDVVIHLAGLAKDTADDSLFDYYMEVNYGLTKRIFDVFMRSDAHTFIFFSSVKAAIPSLSEGMVTEDRSAKPKGPYGESKIKSEEYLRSRKSEADALRKNIYILRPAMIYGMGNRGNLRSMFDIVSKGIPWPFGAFENRRSFCSIDNISYVVERLFISPEGNSCEVYNVCDDEALSTNELVSLISESVGKEKRIWRIPKRFWSIMAFIGSTLNMPFNKHTLAKLTENYIVDNSKIKRSLGIERMPYQAENCLMSTFKSFNEQ